MQVGAINCESTLPGLSEGSTVHPNLESQQLFIEDGSSWYKSVWSTTYSVTHLPEVGVGRRVSYFDITCSDFWNWLSEGSNVQLWLEKSQMVLNVMLHSDSMRNNISKLAHHMITSNIETMSVHHFPALWIGLISCSACARLPARSSLVHQAVSPHERQGSGNETKPASHCDAFISQVLCTVFKYCTYSQKIILANRPQPA